MRSGRVTAMYSCSSDEFGGDTALAPTPISALRRVLVVTHTEGFRHRSI
jgi:hypothetical protein